MPFACRAVPGKSFPGTTGATMARFSIDFSEQSDQDLDALTRELGVKSKAEVVRKALSLLRFIVKAQSECGRLIVENPNEKSQREVITL